MRLDAQTPSEGPHACCLGYLVLGLVPWLGHQSPGAPVRVPAAVSLATGGGPSGGLGGDFPERRPGVPMPSPLWRIVLEAFLFRTRALAPCNEKLSVLGVSLASSSSRPWYLVFFFLPCFPSSAGTGSEPACPEKIRVIQRPCHLRVLCRLVQSLVSVRRIMRSHSSRTTQVMTRQDIGWPWPVPV